MATLAEQVPGERMARVALSMIAEPNDPATGHVLAQVGGVETLRLIEADEPVPGLDRVEAMLWRERVAARITPDLPGRVAAIQGGEFGTLIPADAEWPAGLGDLGDRAPYLLWTRGASSFLTTALSDRVTITGSRAATAYGIEGAAHTSVLAASGHTIAVLAGGLDRPYPAGHSDLLNRIGDVGLLVCELPPGATPTRHRFLARNRLMAALSGATVVPEAGVRSGSMSTVLQARDLGRGVGAVPGAITSAASSGPNQLIKQGLASLITEPNDVIALLDADDATTQAVTRQVGPEFGHRRPEPGTPGRSL